MNTTLLRRSRGAGTGCLLLMLFAGTVRSETPYTLLEQGYRQMYNLQFEQAHQSFSQWEKLHPDDPFGPVSDAAAYLFDEFDRLRILQSEFFTDDDNFLSRQKPKADPVTKKKFEAALGRSYDLAQKALKANPQDENAMFSQLLRLGLHSDYLALIEKSNFAALKEVKAARTLAEQLLARNPTLYDAYIAVGVENYLLSLKPAPVRWFLRMGGAQTDKETGVAKLRITAEKGHYLKPYAQLLIAVADLRDGDKSKAKLLLGELSREFPQNRLYRSELARLK